jgi:hypothetical protein
MAMATQWPGTAPSQAEETLGVRFRPTRETLADTIRWLHRAGHVSAREAGRLAEGAHDR